MPSVAREHELKFGTAPDFSVSEVITSVGVPSVVGMPELNLRAIYYDTDDLRLARSGVTLRYRTGEDSGPAWTVKFPTKDTSVRQEVSLSGSAASVPQEAIDLVTAFTRGMELVRVTTLSTRRMRWSVRDDDGHEMAEVVDDSVAVRDGRRITQRFRELEVEARTENGQGLKQIAAALTQRGAARLPMVPKLMRALGSRATAPSDLPQPQRVTPRSPASDAVRAVLAQDLQNLIVNDPGVRLEQAEGVHQMRVAARRMRSHLRLFGPLLDPSPSHLIDDLRWLARNLGRVRDLDVQLKRLEDQASDLLPDLQPVVDRLAARQDEARHSLRQVLSSEKYVHFLDNLLRYVHQPGFSSAADQECRTALPRLADTAYTSLVEAVETLERGRTDEHYHEVRIHAKRMRYAGEAVANCLAKQPRTDALRLARLAENVQNILGERQDAAVMRQLLLDTVAEQPADCSFAVSLGRLVERQHQSIRVNEEDFWGAWAELDRKKNRAWLNR